MTPTVQSIQHDTLAMSIASALVLANEEAASRGTNLSQCLVSVMEDSAPPERVWRIHYGPRDFPNRRGGDLIVLIDENAGSVSRVIRGQ